MSAWWRRRDQDEECEQPSSHLARSMAYELLVVAFTAVAAAALAFLLSRGQLEDLYIKARGSAPTSGEVAVLSIGPEALYLWDPSQPQPQVTPRAMLAELVRFADAAGASVVVLDVLMPGPEAGDAALNLAVKSSRAPVLAATRFEPTAPTAKREFQAGLSPTLIGLQSGFANLQIEQPWLFSDAQLVRAAPLVRQLATARVSPGAWPMNIVGAEQSDHTLVPSMTLLAAALHKGQVASLAEACPVVPGEPLACTGGAEALGLPATPLPLHRSMLINFRGPEGHDGIPSVRAASVLRASGAAALGREMGLDMPLTVPTALREALQGKVVLIGRVDRIGQGDADRFVTPYSFPTLVGADMAGVRVQAQIVDTLLTGRHIRQPNMAPFWVLGVLLAAGVLASSWVVRDDLHSVAWVGIAGIILGVGVLVFRLSDGWSMPMGPPLAGLLIALLAVHGYGWSVEESKRT